MGNQYKDAMSQRTDEELITILKSNEGDYQAEAVEAAISEAKTRNL